MDAVSTTGWFILALLVMAAGVVGAVVPLVPGMPLVVAGSYLYGLGTGLSAGVGVGHLVVYSLLGGTTMLAGLGAHALGARAAGGSRLAVVGAVLGLFAGLVLGGPVGLLIGPFLGAFAMELLVARREPRQALRTGTGAALGFLASTAIEFAVSLGIIASFVVSALAPR